MIKDENVKNLIEKICIVSENKNELYNILIPLVLSKKFLKNKNEKKEFVENILGFEIAGYAYNSKTILIGKIVSNINNLDVQEAVNINDKVNNFLIEVSKANKSVTQQEKNLPKAKSKKVKRSSFFSNWNAYISDKNVK